MLQLFFDGEVDTISLIQLESHPCQCQPCRELLADLLLERALGRVTRQMWGRLWLLNCP